jgi:glycosyltransferase involved in cell wall biosynthesis
MVISYDGSLVNRPLVSVILPVRDRAWCVARAIRSVLAQTYQELELIVVDDGSTDGTREIVESFGSAVKLLTQSHKGVYAARNVALRHARGELIAFIDSDDAWYPEKLALQVPLFERAEVGLVYGDTVHVTRDLQPLGRRSFQLAPPLRGWAARGFAASVFIPMITAVVRRSALEEIGGFPESHQLSTDMLVWFRVALRHQVDYVDVAVADYTVHSGGISAELGRALAARIELFQAELAQTSDRATRKLLRRILFTLALRLAFAAFRGAARNRSEAFAIARRTLATVAGIEAGYWSMALIAHEVKIRSLRALA